MLLSSDIFAYGSVDLVIKFALSNGICFGLVCMWMQAVLCDDENSFNMRMQLLCQDSSVGWGLNGSKYNNLADPIRQLRVLNKSKKLTLVEYIFLEIPAFIEGLLAYHNSKDTSLHPYIVGGQDPVKISPYALPTKLEFQSDDKYMLVHRTYKHGVAGNKFTYTGLIMKMCYSMQSAKKPFTILLHSINHSIALSFRKSKFVIFAVDFMPFVDVGSAEFDNIEQVVDTIFKIFRVDATLASYIELYVSPKNNKFRYESKYGIDSKYFPSLVPVASGNPLLHVAAQNGDLPLIKDIISSVSDPQGVINAKCRGYTPICYAAQSGHFAVVEFLLQHGAEANLTGEKQGYGPLTCSVMAGSVEMLRLLLSYNAEPIIKSCGFDLAKFARESGRLEIAAILEQAQQNKRIKASQLNREAMHDLTNDHRFAPASAASGGSIQQATQCAISAIV